jgi:hypothetical protein
LVFMFRMKKEMGLLLFLRIQRNRLQVIVGFGETQLVRFLTQCTRTHQVIGDNQMLFSQQANHLLLKCLTNKNWIPTWYLTPLHSGGEEPIG